MKKDIYTINEISVMSGLSTRTIRNYLADGQIHGVKKDGKWCFSFEDYVNMLENPYIGPAIKAKSTAPVFDFIRNDKKTDNSVCMIIDRKVNGEEEQSLAEKLCNLVNGYGGVEFRYRKKKDHIRIVLAGGEENVRRIYLEL